jgi:ABC-type uncharacterized transport system involved in gliding motility auxiliary subunit
MKISKKTHQQIRLQNIAFNVMFIAVIGLLAWLSTQYTTQTDWTANTRNTLSEPSQQLLKKLQKPVQVTAFVSGNKIIRKQIHTLIQKYSAYKKDVKITFVNPDIKPDLAREEGITKEGQLIIRYDGRRESLSSLDEQSFTNALQRLANSTQRWVVFLDGHGERKPFGKANFDLGDFGLELKRKGLNVQQVNLIDTPKIPSNTSLLVIASPQSSFLDGETNIINQYIADGGALLWLTEPKQPAYLPSLAKQLGVSFLPGIVVDATTQTFGIDDPTFSLITQYPQHLAIQHIKTMSLFPGAQGVNITSDSPYQADAILSTLERSWTETGSAAEQASGEYTLKFDPDSNEKEGPIDIGLALSRNITNGESTSTQRIAVIGDSDFLTNSFLGNGGNLDIGLSLIQWLNHDDSFIDLPAKTAPDLTLEITPTWTLVFGLGFLMLLPIVFIASGVIIWLKRKKR